MDRFFIFIIFVDGIAFNVTAIVDGSTSFYLKARRRKLLARRSEFGARRCGLVARRSIPNARRCNLRARRFNPKASLRGLKSRRP